MEEKIMSTKRTRKSRNYYGVSGENAYGVYTRYDKVLKVKEDIVKFNVKKFDTFESAEEWADNRFWELQGEEWRNYSIAEIKKKNWLYKRKPCA